MEGGQAMTKEQEAIEILNKFMNNEMQRDKLEKSRYGGWKIGDIYKHLELNPAIETVLSMLKEKDKEIERLEYIKKSFDYVVQKETENKDKQIDLMAETIRKLAISLANYKGSYNKETINFTGNIKDIKQYFERKSKK